jgi:hypothetical protein
MDEKASAVMDAFMYGKDITSVEITLRETVDFMRNIRMTHQGNKNVEEFAVAVEFRTLGQLAYLYHCQGRDQEVKLIYKHSLEQGAFPALYLEGEDAERYFYRNVPMLAKYRRSNWNELDAKLQDNSN